jgi:hypothetical protein
VTYFYLRGVKAPNLWKKGCLEPLVRGSWALRLYSKVCGPDFWPDTLRLCALRPSFLVCGSAALRVCGPMLFESIMQRNKKGAEAPFLSVLLSRLILLGSSPCIVCKLCIGRGVLLLSTRGKVSLLFCRDPLIL